jgi:chromosome segregation ATPase
MATGHTKDRQIFEANAGNTSQLPKRQQQLEETEPEAIARREKLESMAEALRSSDLQVQDAKAAIESLKAKETDATQLVDDLRNQVILLQEENRILGTQLAEAERDVDQQLELSHIRAERRRTAPAKRMRPSDLEDVTRLAERPAKCPRSTISMTVEDMGRMRRLPSADDT